MGRISFRYGAAVGSAGSLRMYYGAAAAPPSASSPGMVQTAAQYSDADATTITSSQLSSNPVNGNYLWAVIKCRNSATCTVTDTRGMTWTDQGGIVEPGTTQYLVHFTAPVIGSGICNVTATFGSSQIQRGIVVTEISGVTAVQGSDEDTSEGDGVTPDMTFNVITAPAFGMMAANLLQGGTSTPTASWTAAGEYWWDLGGTRLYLATKQIAATGGVTGSWTTPSFDRTNEAMIIFTG